MTLSELLARVWSWAVISVALAIFVGAGVTIVYLVVFSLI